MYALQTDQLLTLATVMDEGTFDAAAHRLHITPSAVSQRMRALEQAAGQVLLQRSTPVVPTPAGQALLRYARQLTVLQEDALAELGTSGSDRGVVSIPLAVNADSLATWFLDPLAQLSRQLNAVFDIHREDQEHTAALLRSGTVMAAVTSQAESVQGCNSTPLGLMRYRSVASADYVAEYLAGVPDISIAQHSPVVTYDRKDTLQDRFALRVTGESSGSPRHYVPTSADYARAVERGLGWGMLPEQQCLVELEAGRLLDLAPGHQTDVDLYWQRWNIASPLLDALSEAVLAAASESLRSR